MQEGAKLKQIEVVELEGVRKQGIKEQVVEKGEGV